MRAILAVAAALSMVIVSTGHAQNRFRIGPTYSSISLEDLSGASHSFPSWGGTAALITGDESEIGLSVARYNDLSTDHGVRRLTLYGLAAFAGARFRRDTKKAGTVAVQIDLAPLRITSGCPSTGCDETAVLFAPAYEASVRPAWGRVYGEAGFLLAGVYSQGPDRGIAQGAQGGVGADFYSGDLMWNLNGRLLWLQRNSGEHVFGVQVGASLSPRIGGAR